MSKVIIERLAFCDPIKIRSDNSASVRLVGYNTQGGRVEVCLEKMPTYMLSHVADEMAQALVKVRSRVQNDIDSVRQSLNG